MAVSNFLVAYWYLVVAAPFVAWFGLKFAIKTSPAVEYAVDRYKISKPLFGPILRKIILSRFAGSFAMMHSSGIAVPDAIRSCVGIVHNNPLQHAPRSARQHIAEGKHL